MATLTPFNQSDLLRDVIDPVIRGGICVGLCDHWLAIVKDTVAHTPDVRMAMLRAVAPNAMSYQEAYARARASVGRVEARTGMARSLGHAYEEQTQVMRGMVGMDGIRKRMADDLRRFGASATWTMQLPGIGRHAVAGYHGLVSLTDNMHQSSIYIFDPNLGEYAGTVQQIDLILRDMFARCPGYVTITDLHRLSGH